MRYINLSHEDDDEDDEDGGARRAGAGGRREGGPSRRPLARAAHDDDRGKDRRGDDAKAPRVMLVPSDASLFDAPVFMMNESD